MKLKILVGNGSKIGLLTLPFLIAGIILNLLFPHFFRVGGPALWLTSVSVAILITGIVIWIWTIVLILTKIPRKKLITSGPYSIVRHPLYTGVALLVLPWIGILCNTWLGIFIGIIVYIGSRMYSPEEERILAQFFGEAWTEYCKKVKMPWL